MKQLKSLPSALQLKCYCLLLVLDRACFYAGGKLIHQLIVFLFGKIRQPTLLIGAAGFREDKLYLLQQS